MDQGPIGYTTPTSKTVVIFSELKTDDCYNMLYFGLSETSLVNVSYKFLDFYVKYFKCSLLSTGVKLVKIFFTLKCSIEN